MSTSGVTVVRQKKKHSIWVWSIDHLWCWLGSAFPALSYLCHTIFSLFSCLTLSCDVLQTKLLHGEVSIEISRNYLWRQPKLFQSSRKSDIADRMSGLLNDGVQSIRRHTVVWSVINLCKFNYCVSSTIRTVLEAFCFQALPALVHDQSYMKSLWTWYLRNCLWAFYRIYIFHAVGQKMK